MRDDSDDIITRRLARQRMQTMQPTEAPPAPTGPPPQTWAGATGLSTNASPVNTTMPVGGRQPVGGDMPLPRNTGVTGGMDVGAPAPAGGGSLADAARASAAAGYTDIEGAGNLAGGNFVGNLEGFNTGGWGSQERGTNTMKNSFGKIASRYDPTQAGAAKAMMADPDFRALWPDATLIDHPNQDQIDFDGPGGEPPVDVITSATAGGGGRGWAWQPQGGVADGGAAGGGMPGGPNLMSILGGDDPMDDILKRIADLNSGQTPDAERQALMQMLSGELR